MGVKGTIDKDITLKYEDSSLNISKSASLKNATMDLSKKIEDINNQIDIVRGNYIYLQQEVFIKINDLTTEINEEKEKNIRKIKELTDTIKTIEKIFIISFSLIMLNCIYIIINLNK